MPIISFTKSFFSLIDIEYVSQEKGKCCQAVIEISVKGDFKLAYR